MSVFGSWLAGGIHSVYLISRFSKLQNQERCWAWLSFLGQSNVTKKTTTCEWMNIWKSRRHIPGGKSGSRPEINAEIRERWGKKWFLWKK